LTPLAEFQFESTPFIAIRSTMQSLRNIVLAAGSVTFVGAQCFDPKSKDATNHKSVKFFKKDGKTACDADDFKDGAETCFLSCDGDGNVLTVGGEVFNSKTIAMKCAAPNGTAADATKYTITGMSVSSNANKTVDVKKDDSAITCEKKVICPPVKEANDGNVKEVKCGGLIEKSTCTSSCSNTDDVLDILKKSPATLTCTKINETEGEWKDGDIKLTKDQAGALKCVKKSADPTPADPTDKCTGKPTKADDQKIKFTNCDSLDVGKTCEVSCEDEKLVIEGEDNKNKATLKCAKIDDKFVWVGKDDKKAKGALKCGEKDGNSSVALGLTTVAAITAISMI